MGYKYILPNSSLVKEECLTENNAVIIIGANGSGKSKLGAWMEENNMDNVHRVSAQRSLQFGEYIQLKNFEQAKNTLLYGQEKYEQTKGVRWGFSHNKRKLTTTMLNDYETVLSLLIAKRNIEYEKFIEWCRIQKQNGHQHCETPHTVIDELQSIWSDIFPHRQILFDDSKVMANFQQEDNENKTYEGNDMSDGERVALYLIAQILCIPDNKIIIIDEPELHLNRAIMNKLWSKIEELRKDCLFIYITHDTEFTANHTMADKIWVKSYDGSKWELEKICSCDLPEQLALSIMGNRKPVIFVEGNSESYDTKLYSKIYEKYYIVPCGSCTQVITRTKAMKNNKQLHHVECFGIIDRDYRSDYEINSYKNDGIYTLKVAEVENLFLVEELLRVVNEIAGFKNETNVNNIVNYIINDRFKKQINRQVCEAVVAEIKYKLSVIDISKKNDAEAKKTLDEGLNEIVYDDIKKETQNRFEEVLNKSDYSDVLEVFNCKSLSTSIGQFFDIDNKKYREFILRHMENENKFKIINALKEYLPNEIPIE